MRLIVATPTPDNLESSDTVILNKERPALICSLVINLFRLYNDTYGIVLRLINMFNNTSNELLKKTIIKLKAPMRHQLYAPINRTSKISLTFVRTNLLALYLLMETWLQST